jgi:serine/threonine-protein kinase
MSLVGSALDLTVLGEIASGGMGTVELARLSDPDGDRLVAVKRMHPEYARDPEFVRMFRDEIWLTGSLNHPNVVGLVGWGEDEAGPYLVMEYLDGVALARIALLGLRAGQPIPLELTAHVIARCAEGLHAAPWTSSIAT